MDFGIGRLAASTFDALSVAPNARSIGFLRFLVFAESAHGSNAMRR
jgi:hypothetical protein